MLVNENTALTNVNKYICFFKNVLANVYKNKLRIINAVELLWILSSC